MRQKFEYQVCQIQGTKVTFVNGKWQGNTPVSGDASFDQVLESCSFVWKYLSKMGEDGWELVGAVASPSPTVQTIYLKRAVDIIGSFGS